MLWEPKVLPIPSLSLNSKDLFGCFFDVVWCFTRKRDWWLLHIYFLSGCWLVFLVYAEEGGAACLIWVVEEHCIVSKQEVVHPGLPLATLTPWSEPSCAACLHNPDRTSPQRMNMYGDRGSPCLIPQYGFTHLSTVSLTRNEYETDCIHCISQLDHLGWKPSRCSTISTKFYSTLSYALLMSVLTAIKHFFVACDIFR